MKKCIRDLSSGELEGLCTDLGLPSRTSGQIIHWTDTRGAVSFDEMTDISRSAAAELSKRFFIDPLRPDQAYASSDGTEKYLFSLTDGELIESVIIPASRRVTVCLSTQVGCRYSCPFCASGMKKFRRNLTVGEITAQLFDAQRLSGRKVTNVVFMGMGEPLDNLDNVLKAIHVFNNARGAGIGARKMTVSTCGVVPGIIKLSRTGLQVELSVSLHAADDDKRDILVPVNRRYPLAELAEACSEYTSHTGRIVTLEYTLIKGVNDSRSDAARLAGITRKIRGKVNLIECNAYPGTGYISPGRRALYSFKERLARKGIKATVRRSKGTDILAACGQLAAREHGKWKCGTK